MFSANSKPNRTLPKTHKDFWKERLERRCYTNEGELHEVNEYSIRIQYLGKRKSVALGTTNADAAAIKARDYYLTIVAKGWEEAERIFNPAMIISKSDPSLGDFLTDVEAKADLEPKTFRNYSAYFRRIVADIFNGGGGKAKYDYRRGGNSKWRDQANNIKLVLITPDRINKWRSDYIRKAEDNPLARASAIRSANSYIRCARALFSRKWINRLDVRLPDPLPFTGVRVERYRPPRYHSTIDPIKLLTQAQKELPEKDVPAYQVILLALCAGLRKSEIDGLEWKHINFGKNTIMVEPTEFRRVKTDESTAEVQIDSALSAELEKHLPASKSGFVVAPECPPMQGKKYQCYRAENVYTRVYDWLRSKGVQSRSPLHTLRKEFGSVINHHFGLYAAMTALRHSNIGTTSSYYTDNKRIIAMPVGNIFQGGETELSAK
jgi:integrase